MKPDFDELEKRLRKTICTYCRQRNPNAACDPKRCLLSSYLPRPVAVSSHKSSFDWRVSKVLKVLTANWNKSVYLPELAKKVGVSVSWLEHLFKRDTQTSIRRFLREHRLWNAARLLVTTRMRVSEICYYVGYGDPSNFVRIFKKKYGVSPTQYRSENRRSA